ncbi:vacuolar import and degradation protein-domain-containing protein [Mortierella sp. GBAus27b]|nr:vacuolar import and degradation protein-domain-containing protein [Mortierella sp. GBAus27b]
MSFRHRPDPDGSTTRDTPTLILLTNRRQTQSQQQRLLSPPHAGTRDTSDADVSSDFSSLSEVDLHRGDSHSGDYSDYETPLGGRWDFAAHWHLGDYSEGVEGDADDDDDERDNDTDLSEGTGRSRGIHLDLGRVQEILESSPSSTPIVVTRSPSFWSSFDIASSASEDVDSGYPTHATTVPERTVRFSNREPQRASTSLSTAADSATHGSGRETAFSFNLHNQRHDDIHPDTYHADMDDSHGDGNSGRGHSRTITNSAGNSQDNSNLRNSSNSSHTGGYRVLRLAMISETVQSSPVAHDSESYLNPHGPRPSDQSARTAGSHRIHALQHSVSPSAGREDRRSHHHQHSSALNATNHGLRHNFSSSSSPRSTLASYWSAMPRYHQHAGSTSSFSSLSSSPASSASSSRVASPSPHLDLETMFTANIHDNGDTRGKSLDCEAATDERDGGGGGGGGDRGKGRSGEGDDATEKTTATGSDTAAAATLSISTPSPSNTIESAPTRRVISTTITSLPSFASSVFTPRIQNGMGSVGSSSSHRPLKSNHPRRQCCFLQPGRSFDGTQNLKANMTTMAGQRNRQSEEWNVKVTISAVDYDAGTVYGLMEAKDVPTSASNNVHNTAASSNVPISASNVVTFWEGEIVDFENHTFWTKKWMAKPRTDLEHWKRLEAFQGIDEKYIVKGAKTGKFRGHIDQKYIFMRWKEKHFVNASEHASRLTIAGFYYVSLRRSDGHVEGYYYDQYSAPFQHLCLNPVFDAGGFSSSIFEMA